MMDSTPEAVENRKSIRCLVSRESQSAELYVGPSCIPVSLVDESADGFAALATIDPSVERGMLAELHTRSSDYEVQVAYVRAMGVMAVRDSGQRENMYRIGLQRLRDIPRNCQSEAGEDTRSARRHGLRSPLGLAILGAFALGDVLCALWMFGMVDIPWSKAPIVDTVRAWFQETPRQQASHLSSHDQGPASDQLSRPMP
jgi:hypothetical protein